MKLWYLYYQMNSEMEIVANRYMKIKNAENFRKIVIVIALSVSIDYSFCVFKTQILFIKNKQITL